MNFPKLSLLTCLSLSLPHSFLALKCGQWNTHSCLGDIDIRYDADYTNSITEQNDLWAKQEGFYMVTQTSTQEMAHFNPFDLTETVGLPYDDNAAVSYVNITISGSRRYEHRYIIYPPAPQEFCDLPVPPNATNVLPFLPPWVPVPPGFAPVCGVNGYATFVESFKTSSYEKDGSLVNVGGTFGFAENKDFDKSGDGVAYAIGERSLSFTSSSDRADGGKGIGSKNWIFIGDDFNLARAVLENYNANTADLISSTSYQYTKIASEEEWVEMLQAAFIANNVQSDLVSRGGAVPMERGCLGTKCPNETEWCEHDPECSESPYKEPDARLKAGVIAGFCIAGAAVILAIVSLIFVRRLKQQKERIKAQFASRIAATIDLGLDANIAMNPDALKAEFQKIDSGADDGGDGYISKDELWAFMSSGKAGTMTKKDFDVLFLTLDDDGNGKVDYLEFINFLSTCGAYVEKEVQNKEDFVDDENSA